MTSSSVTALNIICMLMTPKFISLAQSSPLNSRCTEPTVYCISPLRCPPVISNLTFRTPTTPVLLLKLLYPQNFSISVHGNTIFSGGQAQNLEIIFDFTLSYAPSNLQEIVCPSFNNMSRIRLTLIFSIATSLAEPTSLLLVFYLELPNW